MLGQYARELAPKKKPKGRVRPYYDPISADYVLKLGESIDPKNARARALFFLCYLTGCRVGEAVQIPMNKITLTDNFYRVDAPCEKKRWDSADKRRGVVIPRGAKAKCHEDKMMSYVLNYFKDYAPTDLPLYVYGKPRGENPGHPDTNARYLNRACKLITTGRKRGSSGWVEGATIEKPMHPHFLRHCRAHHLVTYYGFTDTKLRQFFNWSNASVAVQYTKFGDIESFF